MITINCKKRRLTFNQVYKRFLARLVISLIRKHFKEGLSVHDYHFGNGATTCYIWKWTKVFEQDLYNIKGDN